MRLAASVDAAHLAAAHLDVAHLDVAHLDAARSGGVQHLTGALRTHDRLTLFTQRWLPDGDPRAVLAIVHGYAEHGGRYRPLAERLVGEGFAVHAMDHRGHGHSEGERANAASVDALIDDVGRFVAAVREEHPELPLFLLGHSMGGAICACYAAEAAEAASLQGLLLSSPYLRNAKPVAPLLLAVAPVVARLAPSLPVEPLDSRLISRDPEMVAAYENDPLVYRGRVKARMGMVLLEGGKRALAGAPRVRQPLLVIHGSADPIADPAGSQEFVARAGSDDKRLELFEGSYHEVLNDLERERAMSEIAAWLNAHLPATTA